jgi:hypothetical protein
MVSTHGVQPVLLARKRVDKLGKQFNKKDAKLSLGARGLCVCPVKLK